MGFFLYSVAWCGGYPRTVLSLEQGLMILLQLCTDVPKMLRVPHFWWA